MAVDHDELEYLRQVELLARSVVACANAEGWRDYEDEPEDLTPLQQAVDKLAQTLVHYHFEGDGCLEERPIMDLGGAALIRPGGSPDDQADGYAGLCRRLGVEPREQGWALWHTWDDQKRSHTLVTTALATTEGLLENWSRGLNVHPATPNRAQIASVVRGWVGPIITAPGHARAPGLGGV